MTARGTCRPLPVSLKKVENESSLPPSDCKRRHYTRNAKLNPRLVRRHLAVRLNAVLEAVQLPARIANLHAGLADVDRDDLTLETRRITVTRASFSASQHACLLEYSSDDKTPDQDLLMAVVLPVTLAICLCLSHCIRETLSSQ